MENKFKSLIGERFRHYKGNEYQLIGYANHSETLEKMVIYQALYEDYKVWVRPFEMFFDYVMLEDNKCVRRFEHIKIEKDDKDENDFEYTDYEEIKEDISERIEKFNEEMKEYASKAKHYTKKMFDKAANFVKENIN